jgi:hypothetical protein
MLPTGTNCIPDFGEADEEIMEHWRQIQILYAAKADAINTANLASSTASSTSSNNAVSTMMDISAANLQRKSDVQEMYNPCYTW